MSIEFVSLRKRDFWFAHFDTHYFFFSLDEKLFTVYSHSYSICFTSLFTRFPCNLRVSPRFPPFFPPFFKFQSAIPLFVEKKYSLGLCLLFPKVNSNFKCITVNEGILISNVSRLMNDPWKCVKYRVFCGFFYFSESITKN